MEPSYLRGGSYYNQLKDSFVTRTHIFEYEKLPDWISAVDSTVSLSKDTSQVGSRSLKWDIKPGAKLIIRLPKGELLGKNPAMRGGHSGRFHQVFGLHSFVKNAGPGVLTLRFMKGDTQAASFNMPLSFPWWQRIAQPYHGIRNRNNHNLTLVDRIEFVASKGVKPTSVYFDCLSFRTVADKAGGFRTPKGSPSQLTVDPYRNPTDPRLKQFKFDRKLLLAPPTKEEREYVEKRTQLRSGGKVLTSQRVAFLRHKLTHSRVLGWGPLGIRDYRKAGELAQNWMYPIAQTYDGARPSKQKEELLRLYLRAEKSLIEMGFVPSGSISLSNKQNLKYTNGISRFMKSGAFARTINDGEKKTAAMIFERVKSAGSLGILFNVDDPHSRRPEWLNFYPPVWSGIAWGALTIDEKVIYLRFFTKRVANIVSNQSNSRIGWKDDGTLIDHGMQYPTYSSTALNNVASYLNTYSNSPFKMSEASYLKFRKLLMTTRWYSNLHIVAKGHNGRRGNYSFSKNKSAWINLYHASPAYNNGKHDPEIAAALARLFPDIGKNIKVEPEAAPQGNYSMPFAGTVSHRRDEWLAIVRGSGEGLRPYESLRGMFREGRFMGNGTLDLLTRSPGGDGSNGIGFDWRMLDGATTTLAPYSELAGKWGSEGKSGGKYANVGGVSHRGRNGAFMLPLDKQYALVDARKSYFFFGDRIICLGSDISSDRDTPTVTTLFQKYADSGLKQSIYDGKIVKNTETVFPVLLPQSSHYLLDPQNNGYYIPKGNKILYTHRDQKVEGNWLPGQGQSRRYFIACFDHGIKPTDARYSYIVKVKSSAEEMAEFSKKMDLTEAPVTIVKQDKDAHIVYDREENTWAAAFFEPLKSDDIIAEAPSAPAFPVVSTDRSCLVMAQKDQAADRDTWLISMANPDHLRSQPITIEVKGKWKLAKEVDRISLTEVGENTKITLTTRYGYTADFTLIRQTSK